jgi:integrase
MASRGDSSSKVKQARTYLAAALEYALDERLIESNPARKLELPTKLLRKPCERFYSLEEVRRLLSKAHGREHLVLRIFINCGLRPGELFALRDDDVEPGQLRITRLLRRRSVARSASVTQKRWAARRTCRSAKAYRKNWIIWLEARRQQRPYHATSRAAASDLVFPNEAGRPFRLGNYLKRYLKPLDRPNTTRAYRGEAATRWFAGKPQAPWPDRFRLWVRDIEVKIRPLVVPPSSLRNGR